MRWLIRSRVMRCVVASLLVALLATLLGGAVQAQNTTRKLKVGDTVSGVFDAKTFAQVYTFDAIKGDSITLTATSKTKGLLLALLLNNADGQTLTQVADLTRGETVIRDFKPDTDGTYYITVLRATGVQGNTPGSFSLSLTGTSSASTAPSVTLTDGMTVTLNWASTDDMNLEVRDPVGGAVNFNNPAVNSGGRLSGNVNADCATPTSDAAESVNWAKGNVPSGSYEIIVYFAKACPQGTTTPLDFTITVTVDGKAQDPIRGTLSAAGQEYVASYVLSAPDQLELKPGAPYLAADFTPFDAKIAAPGTLNTQGQATGAINGKNPGDAYTFQGKAGETVTIRLRATGGGSLDPYLALLDASGTTIASNDDENNTTRNSLITTALPTDGKYTIIATRFAQAGGGTEGYYLLTLIRGRAAGVPTSVPVTPVNQTIPATAAATASVGSGLPPGSIEAVLSWNSKADLRLLIRDPQGRSVYTDNPRIDSGGILSRSDNLNCKTLNGVSPLDYIYWNAPRPPAGTYEVKVFENGNCGDSVPVTFTLNVNVSGQQVLNVSAAPGPNKQVYLLTFTVDANGNGIKDNGNGDYVTNEFTADISSAIQSATNLVYNQAAVTGRITADAKYTVYTFKAIAGDKITITMNRTDGNLDAVLFLIGPDGKAQLAFNDDDTALSNGDSRIRYTMTADGTYIIIATHYGVELGGTLGGYRLQLAGPTR